MLTFFCGSRKFSWIGHTFMTSTKMTNFLSPPHTLSIRKNEKYIYYCLKAKEFANTWKISQTLPPTHTPFYVGVINVRHLKISKSHSICKLRKHWTAELIKLKYYDTKKATDTFFQSLPKFNSFGKDLKNVSVAFSVITSTSKTNWILVKRIRKNVWKKYGSVNLKCNKHVNYVCNRILQSEKTVSSYLSSNIVQQT